LDAWIKDIERACEYAISMFCISFIDYSPVSQFFR
jgi:hypothetical protein